MYSDSLFQRSRICFRLLQIARHWQNFTSRKSFYDTHMTRMMLWRKVVVRPFLWSRYDFITPRYPRLSKSYNRAVFFWIYGTGCVAARAFMLWSRPQILVMRNVIKNTFAKERCIHCSTNNRMTRYFTVIPRNRPVSVAFYDAHGDTEDLFSSYTPTLGSPHPLLVVAIGTL